MATFPSTLPVPLRDGHESTAEDPVLHTDMQAGAPRTRRQFTAIPDNTVLSWVFTLAEMALFEAWHKYESLDGSAWFAIDLPNGLGMQTVDAKFKKPLKKALLGGMNWHVSGEVQVRSRTTITSAEMDVALAYSPNDITYASPVLHILLNSTLPTANYW